MTTLDQRGTRPRHDHPTASRPRARALALALSGLLTSGLVLATAQPASAATYLGGTDIAAYCAAKVPSGSLAASRAVNINNRWDGWRCATRTGLVQLDMNAVCDFNYPKAWFWQPKAFAGHSASATSWRCYR